MAWKELRSGIIRRHRDHGSAQGETIGRGVAMLAGAVARKGPVGTFVRSRRARLLHRDDACRIRRDGRSNAIVMRMPRMSKCRGASCQEEQESKNRSKPMQVPGAHR